jgi:uncharacterized membrane protein (GlpM family)
MTSQTILIAIFQGALCFIIVALLRIAIVYLGSRRGGILVGTPMLIFPLLALQAWFGPPVTQAQTFGSISSITAITAALWPMWLPIRFSPLGAMLITAASWAVVLSFIYVTGVPAWVLSAAVISNAIFILSFKRDHRPAVEPERAKLTKAAIPTAIFLFIFFAAKEFLPDFVRGVMAMFPIVMLATVYFVRSTSSDHRFRDFVGYSHSATVATAIFIVAVHFSLGSFPIAISLAIGLLMSVLTSLTIGWVWRMSAVAVAEVERAKI